MKLGGLFRSFWRSNAASSKEEEASSSPPSPAAISRQDSFLGDLPQIRPVKRSGSVATRRGSTWAEDKRPSFPGELVNKRASVAMDVMMPFRKPKTLYENMVDWSMVTNIHGTFYVFEQDARLWSQLFWGATWLALFAFSLYMIAVAYIGWSDNPVLTTVSTTALPIEEIEFPVVTICGLGTIKETVEIAYRRQIVRYLREVKGVNDDDKLLLSSNISADELLGVHKLDFLRDSYPGATMSPVEMVATLTSQNPIEHIRAQVVVGGGYNNQCGNVSNYSNDSLSSSSSAEGFCNNLLYDPDTDNCYEYSAKVAEFGEAYWVCWNKLGYMIYPFSDQQLLGIIRLIERGPLKVLKSGKPFWVDLTRSADGSYKLLDGQKLTNTTFRYLNLTHTDDLSQRCFIMHYSARQRLFIGKQTSCKHSYPSLCYSHLQDEESNNCTTAESSKETSSLGNETTARFSQLDRLLNPKTRSDINRDVAQRKKKYYKAFRSLDLRAAYKSLFELLWYSQLPCFDVNGSFDYPSQRSLLKQCKWKGIVIPCSAIFKTVPTDRGMCCTFNTKAADDIFKESAYQTMVSWLQERDRNDSFAYSGLPEWYQQASEPRSQQGIARGLTLTLDAHTDQIGSSTISEDFQGFIAIISSSNSYPLAGQESIRLKAGHDTLVAMSAIDVQADLQKMDVRDRKCYYSNGKEEDDILKIHKRYTQTSCILECQIDYAMERMTQVGEEPCIPWYLPTLTKDAQMCNPWSAGTFREQIDLIPNDQCSHCLADCKSTTYRRDVTTAPFRRCDSKNLGISNFCNLYGSSVPDPPIYGERVLQEYRDAKRETPNYVKNIQSNERIDKGGYVDGDGIFQQQEDKYDAYEKDIAVVNFYFETPNVFQYTRQPRMSWIDFLSQVGGLLGLCLGYSICMGVEVLYWTTVRLWWSVKVNAE